MLLYLHAGRDVLGQLLVNPKWGSVTAVGRRPAEVPEAYRTQPGFDPSKLQQAVVNMDHLDEEAKLAFAGADSVFCCLGTTRSVSPPGCDGFFGGAALAVP
jgi:oxidoreductase